MLHSMVLNSTSGQSTYAGGFLGGSRYGYGYGFGTLGLGGCGCGGIAGLGLGSCGCNGIHSLETSTPGFIGTDFLPFLFGNRGPRNL